VAARLQAALIRDGRDLGGDPSAVGGYFTPVHSGISPQGKAEPVRAWEVISAGGPDSLEVEAERA